MAAVVGRAPTFEVRAVTALFAWNASSRFGAIGGRIWDISPLDGRFLRTKDPDAAQSGVRVVMNWTQELRRLMEQ